MNLSSLLCFSTTALCVIFLVSCSPEEIYPISEEEQGIPPTVITQNPDSIAATGAKVGGEVFYSGGSPVSERGIVVATSEPHSLADGIVFNAGSGPGAFSVTLSGLESNTNYFYKAFASFTGGTVFGSVKSFSTISAEVLSETWNCESLIGVTSSYTEWTGTAYETAPWVVGAGGYMGNCWWAPDPEVSSIISGGSHFVEFNVSFPGLGGFVEFWTRNCYPGNSNAIPGFYLDGSPMPTLEVVEGSTWGCEWMKVRTSDIPSGQHTLRFQHSQSYYTYRIDEMSFYEYQ